MAMGTEAKSGAPAPAGDGPVGDVVAMVSLRADGTPAQSGNYLVAVPGHERPAAELDSHPEWTSEFGKHRRRKPGDDPVAPPTPAPVAPAPVSSGRSKA